jgi:hypothetical protein
MPSQKPVFIHKGAMVLLVLPFLSWGGITLVGAVESIAMLKAKEASHNQLILRVDKRVENQNAKFERINSKLDKIIFEINKK